MLYRLFFWGIPIGAFCSYMLLLIFFAISKKDKAIKAFQPLLLSLLLWVGGSLLMKLNCYPSVLFWNKVMLAGTFVAPFCMYVFLSVFTDTVRLSGILLMGSMTGLGLAFNFMGLVVSKAELITGSNETGIFQNVEFRYTLGPMAVAAYVLMFASVLLLFDKSRTCLRRKKAAYNRLRPIMVGIVITFLGLMANLVPALGKYPIDLLAAWLLCILFIVAIYKNRMLEMKFMLTTGMVYSVFAVLLTTLYVIVVMSAQPFFSSLSKELGQYFVIAAALAIAITFQPLFALARKLSNRLFYRSEYNKRTALNNFTLNVSNNLDLSRIGCQVVESLEAAMGAQRAALMLKDNDGGYSTYTPVTTLNHMDLHIAADSPLIRSLTQDGHCITKEQLEFSAAFKSMWDSERRALKDLEVELIAPVRCRGMLIGILLLTGKNNHMAYTLDDLELLTSFGASTAIAIENAQLYTKAQEEAVTDDLTGLRNHRYLFQMLDDTLPTLGEKPLSILALDLDMFKLYNDMYGYSEGDSALKKVAAILRERVDYQGEAIRFSGEQFMMVLPGLDTNHAFTIAERVRKQVEKEFLGYENSTNRFLTVSIGICTYPLNASDKDQLIKRANFALYNAKQRGKNQTVIYTPASEIQEDKEDKELALTSTIYALTAAIDAKDHYTFGHSQKVAHYAQALARELGMDEQHAKMIGQAGLLHDIGKIGVPESILSKSGKLSDEEFDTMKRHVEMSIAIVKHLPSANHAIPGIVGHHERMDGTGYPRGLRGENIPIEARILSVCDVFDAIISFRPYKKSLSVEYAIGELEKNSGSQFDPVIVKTFVNMIRTGKIQVERDIPAGMMQPGAE